MTSRAAELDVSLLLFAIQKTSTFEKQLATKYYLSKYMKKVGHCGAWLENVGALWGRGWRRWGTVGAWLEKVGHCGGVAGEGGALWGRG